jgi:hypothetical protein
MARALDILLHHDHADPERVAVAGLSGGGWQTIFFSALDTRVTLANPVAGYSSFRTRARYPSDLGDSEQTPNDLGTLADYTHLTALLAPRPALLTFNEKDNCCFASGHALAPLWDAALPVYKLFGRENHLRFHINADPGDHNFGEDNRRALYTMFEDFFAGANGGLPAGELPFAGEIKSYEQLRVDLPPDNANLNQLAIALAQHLPRHPDVPSEKAALAAWRESRREQLDDLIRALPYRISPAREATLNSGPVKASFWRLHIRGDWTLPAVELAAGEPAETVILIHDGGRAEAWNRAAELVAAGKRVVCVDLFYFGESRIASRDFLYAMLVAAMGNRPLGLQASQLGAVARWIQWQYRPGSTTVEAHGPRSSLIALTAACLEQEAIKELKLHGSLGSLKEIVEQNWGVNQRPEWFCFGLLEAFDIRQLVALAAPVTVRFNEPSGRLREQLRGFDPAP